MAIDVATGLQQLNGKCTVATKQSNNKQTKEQGLVGLGVGVVWYGVGDGKRGSERPNPLNRNKQTKQIALFLSPTIGEGCLALQIAKNMVMYVCEHFRPGWIDIPNWPSYLDFLPLSLSFFSWTSSFSFCWPLVVGSKESVAAGLDIKIDNENGKKVRSTLIPFAGECMYGNL